ncbi:MAG: hypothetical protein HY372_01540, partial [Candidatus Andersenbacteria bacterium]|nr:hypothetical protein [Candidatus Andersenbacteria bacterium]
ILMRREVRSWLGPTDESIIPLRQLRGLLRSWAADLSKDYPVDARRMPWSLLCADPYWPQVQEIVAGACYEQGRTNAPWLILADVLKRARHCAVEMHHGVVEPLHVLLALSEIEFGQARRVLHNAGCTSEQIAMQVRERFTAMTEAPNAVSFSDAVASFILKQSKRVTARADSSITTGTLLLDLINSPSRQVVQFLAAAGMRIDRVCKSLEAGRNCW